VKKGAAAAVETGTVVIGAGLAGLSAAYHLSQSRERGVVVVEREAAAGRHASGKNAGMIRQTYSDPVLVHLARLGRDAMAAAQSDGWKLDFRSEGSLLLVQKWDEDKLRGIALAAERENVPCRWLSNAEAARLVPPLKDAAFSKALYCPTDGLVSISALLDAFLGVLKKKNVPVFYGCPLETVERVDGGFVVTAGRRRFAAARVVNAAGAWASDVARKAGATAVPMRAYRRHLYVSPGTGASKRWPFVWDLSHDLYFRPVKEGLLLSPCDKALIPLEESSKSEAVDPDMSGVLTKKLGKFSPKLARLKLTAGRAALRTMTPDGRFVIGEDPALKGFFWVAGLGGHGVTTSFSVGRLVADLVLGRHVNAAVAKALSPARFASKKKEVHAAA
jgi:D-arginine dehydrogenase